MINIPTKIERIFFSTGRGSGHGSDRVETGTAWVGSGQIIGSWSRVGSGPDPGRSGRVRKIGPGNNSGVKTGNHEIESIYTAHSKYIP